MWNKFVEILQTPSHQRLALAIIVSAILHAVLFGGLGLSLPDLKKEMHTIEARIQMPKAVAAPAASGNPAQASAQAKAPAKENTPQEEPPQAPPSPDGRDDAPDDAQAPIQTEESPDTTAGEEANAPPAPAQASEPFEELSQTERQQRDMGLVINENAYQYVETEFDVRTKANGDADGKASIIYNVVEGNKYQIKWLTEGTGFAALLFPSLLQTSEGELTKTGLRPHQYLYQFGTKVEKNRSAIFDWQAKKVSLQTAKGTKTEDLPEGTQDLLSFMYQFMHVAPLQHMQLAIANGKKLRTYDYTFEGEENVDSALGEVKTLHIVHNSVDSDEKTELWLAIDYQYLPVKIRKIESDSKLVEMIATRINTSRPTIDRKP